jgi:hypothetical protein
MAVTVDHILKQVNSRTALLARTTGTRKLATQVDDDWLLKQFLYKGTYKILIARGVIPPESVYDPEPTTEQVTAVMAEIFPEHEDCLVFYILFEWFRSIGEQGLKDEYEVSHDKELDKYRFVVRTPITAERPYRGV